MVERIDREELSELFARCADAGDNGELEEFLDCFADDAVLVHSGRPAGDPAGAHTDLGEIRGRAAIRRFREGLSPEPRRRHLLSNLCVSRTAADESVITSQVATVVAIEAGGPRVLRVATYHDQVSRGCDGLARITSRRIVLEEPLTPVSDLASSQDLVERVARLEAERDIVDVLYRYGQGITLQDEDLWLSVFTPSAQVRMRYGSGKDWDVEIDGREDLMRWFRAHVADWPAGSEAQVTANPRVEVDGTSATATSTLVVFLIDDSGHARPRTVGRYRDTLECDRGVWRIARREVKTLTLKQTYGLEK